MSKPSSGPWSVVGISGTISDANGQVVASVGFSRLPDEYEADAKLIAAAPELLHALKSLLVLVPEKPHPIETAGRTVDEALENHNRAMQKHRAKCPTCRARAAIAKAEGRS